jgi:Protein of unknown function (DUF2505)
MRFTTEQRFAAPAADVLALFVDPDFYATLVGLPTITTPEVVDHVVDGSTVHLRLHQRYIGDVPSAARRFIDPSKLGWIEHLDFDLTEATATSRLEPDHYPDRLTCSGRYVFRADGDPSHSVRRIDGELKVRVPLVGGKVEGALVSGFREHAVAEAELVTARLASS